MPTAKSDLQTWEIWFPGAGATGLHFARARIDPTPVVWVHAAPMTISVTVREDEDRRIASGERLKRAGAYLPMTRLAIENGGVIREDRWPTEGDLGSVVILPGGEAGKLLSWWNAEDESEWRWEVEFYNKR